MYLHRKLWYWIWCAVHKQSLKLACEVAFWQWNVWWQTSPFALWCLNCNMMRAIAHYFTMIVDLVNAIRSHQNSCALSLFFPGISAHGGIFSRIWWRWRIQLEHSRSFNGAHTHLTIIDIESTDCIWSYIQAKQITEYRRFGLIFIFAKLYTKCCVNLLPNIQQRFDHISRCTKYTATERDKEAKNRLALVPRTKVAIKIL